MTVMPLLLVVVTSFVMTSCSATTDPLTSLCDHICWEEEAMADECVETSCSRSRVPKRKQRRRCRDGCWMTIVGPCRSWCGTHAFDVLDDCHTFCSSTPANGNNDTAADADAAVQVVRATADTAGDCEWGCYTHNMRMLKAQQPQW